MHNAQLKNFEFVVEIPRKFCIDLISICFSAMFTWSIKNIAFVFGNIHKICFIATTSIPFFFLKTKHSTFGKS